MGMAFVAARIPCGICLYATYCNGFDSIAREWNPSPVK